VPSTNGVLFDDRNVHCLESMIHNYLEYISKISFESELDLLKYCNINIFTSIHMQNKLKYTSCCCMRLMLQNQENWQKSWQIVVIRQSLPKFLLYSNKHLVLLRTQTFTLNCC